MTESLPFCEHYRLERYRVSKQDGVLAFQPLGHEDPERPSVSPNAAASRPVPGQRNGPGTG
jgi:hypothetical protein